jgi:GNAT superfamily N-acetyltransferase
VAIGARTSSVVGERVAQEATQRAAWHVREDGTVGRNDGVVVRRAAAADAGALVALRAEMFVAMGHDVGPPEAPWRTAAAAWFAERLGVDERVAVFVAEHPDAGVVACALGTSTPHLPGPRNPSGSRGHVSNICTLPAYRRQGLARACVEALLDWFRTTTDVGAVHLSATAAGLGLYEALGFRRPEHPYLTLRLR